jgi:hypothetical protein
MESATKRDVSVSARKGRFVMKTWPKESRFRQLIQWVQGESSDLTEGRDQALLDLMDRVIRLLDTPAQGDSQMLLIFSATMQCVKRAERLVLDALRLDNWITMQEEAILVHLRLACCEMIGLLSNASDELRLVPVEIRR